MKRKSKQLLALLIACLMLITIAACGKKTTDDASGSGGGAAAGGSPSSNSPDGAGGSGSSGDSGGAPGAGGPGSSDGGAGGPSTPGRTLNVGATADSGTLYPLGATGGYFSVLYAFYEPLFDYTQEGDRVWALATNYDPISDIQYTLKIREGVTFSNGNPLTAEDVMFTMELCRDNPQFSLNVKAIDFEKTKVIDEYTIDVWYTVYNAAQEVGMSQMLIMDKESFDEVSLSIKPIGTGPYVVTDYVVNSHLYLQARQDYWGGTPAIENVHYFVINEEAQIVNALETGDIDIAGIPINEIDYVSSLGYNVETSNSAMNHAAWYSMLPGTPLESKEARWAVSHAIDREAITDILFKGRAEICNAPVSKYCIDFEPRFANMHETYTIGYNPEKARALAEQSGLIGKSLRIITNGASANNTLAEIIQGSLLEIGVGSEIIAYDQAAFFGTMMDASNFEIAVFNPAAPSMMAVDVLAMYLTFIPLGWEGADRDRYFGYSMGAIGTAEERARQDKLFDAINMWVEFDPWFGLCEVITTRAYSNDLRGMESQTGYIYYCDLSWG